MPTGPHEMGSGNTSEKPQETLGKLLVSFLSKNIKTAVLNQMTEFLPRNLRLDLNQLVWSGQPMEMALLSVMETVKMTMFSLPFSFCLTYLLNLIHSTNVSSLLAECFPGLNLTHLDVIQDVLARSAFGSSSALKWGTPRTLGLLCLP